MKGKDFEVRALNEDRDLLARIKDKIDNKTKPIGSLGRLEEIALQIALIQGDESPKLVGPTVLVFAGDHGIAKEGVSAYPQEVTFQMVLNFLRGGAAINIFCEQNGLEFKIIDAGVNHKFENFDGFIDNKIGFGTKSFLNGPAMSNDQFFASLLKGAEVSKCIIEDGTNVIGFGEMGIGNTSSASCIMHLLSGIPLAQCVGSGSGLDPKGIERKTAILKKAIEDAGPMGDVDEILAYFGGFEIVQIVGAMLKAAENRALILVDGFIVTAAFLGAMKKCPEIIDYALFTHRSDESGHGRLLNHLNVNPIMDLALRLGEGTGCALAYPIVKAAISFINEMASFKEAGVSSKS